jgi:hypothetical protein
LLQLASLLKIGDTWRGQVRRKGTIGFGRFPTKAQAAVRARKIEAEMDANAFNGARDWRILP